MNFIQRMMYGRYGGDQLGICLMVVYGALYLLSVLLQMSFIYWIGTALIVYGVFRMTSRNIERRRAENTKFLTLVGPLVRWFKLRMTIYKDKEHRYFKCPNCGQQLRVPRGKGKLTVNCRNCGVSFEEKT